MKKRLLAAMTIALMFCACENQTSEILTEASKNEVEVIITDDILAEVEAITDLLNNSPASTRSGITREIEEIRPLYVREAELEESQIQELGLQEDDAVGVVVNYKEDNGYVVMTNDPTQTSVLAVKTTGNMEPETEINRKSVALLSGISGIKEAVDEIDPQGGPAIQKLYSDWVLVEEVTPMLYDAGIQYDQGNPYNLWCPKKDSRPVFPKHFENPLPAGCAPVAYAQVMAYHHIPTNIDWESENCYNKEANDVAYLIRQIGNDLHAQYFDGGTFVSPYSEHDIRNLKSYINYLPFIDFTKGYFNDDMSKPFKKRNYSHSGKWQNYKEEEILADMKNFKPVIVLGMSNAFKYWQKFEHKRLWHNGHYFVIDGYMIRKRTVTTVTNLQITSTEEQQELLFHCNMGHANGRDNGYYNSGLFDITECPIQTRGWFKKIGGFICDLLEDTFEWGIDQIMRPINVPVYYGEINDKDNYSHYLHILNDIEP